MLKRLNHAEYSKIMPLVGNNTNSFMLACLSGEIGEVFVDDDKCPKSVMLAVNVFSYFFGEPNAELANNIPATVRNEGGFICDPSASWVALFEQIYGDNLQVFTRYAFCHDKSGFDKDKLMQNISRISDKFAIVPINAEIYHSVMAQEWSVDLCSTFFSCEDYLARGRGFVALIKETGELVCGASSFAKTPDGIEIEIDTKKEHRQKGLASACASALILDCLKDGLYPSWDAANLISASLAKKLGYTFSHEYNTYFIKKE